MTHRMIFAAPGMEEEYLGKIREKAEEKGWTVSFFNSAEEALPYVSEAEIIVSSSPELAAGAAKLRWFCSPFAGVDPFLRPGVFASPDVMLSNSSGAYGVTIAEHVVMTALEMLRRQAEYAEIVRKREWTRNLTVRSLKDSRITMMGTGDIGCEITRRMRAFGPRSIMGFNRGGKNPENLFDRIVTERALEDVLPETDLLIMALPATEETRCILNRDRIALLPDHALIVNVGRGSALDQRALEKELRAGRLCAALDVFETEPIPADDSLWDCPNLLITPHTAGNMTLAYTRRRITELFLEDFDNYCAGRPLLRRVDLKKGY